MKKMFTSVFCLFLFCFSQAQLKVFAKFTNSSGLNIHLFDENPNGGVHQDEIPVTTYSDGEGRGIGEGPNGETSALSLSEVVFSKPASVNSALFLGIEAQNAPFDFVEFNFYNSADQLLYKVTLKYVLLSGISRAAATCSGDCPGMVENISAHFGAKVITSFALNPDGSPTQQSYSYGWNTFLNMPDNNPAAPISK